ncbi:MAG: phytoene desaturase family protein [Acidimicrobiales bacterium]
MSLDAIVVGGGHNGLACAAYLARAGLRTTVVEARDSVGGCASTVDAIGARVNICNCDHGVVRSTPMLDELRLADHGLRYLEVDPCQVSLSWAGGPAWPIFHDVDRTLDALALTYPGQVDGYRRYLAAARPVADLALACAAVPPTRARLLRRVLERHGRGVSTLLRWSRMSVGDVLRSFFTEEALLAPAVVVGPAVWGLSPEFPGTGLGAITYAMKHASPVGRPAGGSGALTDALRDALLAAGGTVRCGARVEAITCEGERVRGVGLVGGEELTAPIVVSACDPHSTFLAWLRNPPAAATPVIERWRRTPHHEGYESKLDAVVASPPRFRQLDAGLVARLGFDPAHATTIVAPTLAAMHEAHAAMGRGQVADEPMLFANTPSVLDPSMQAGDDHVFSLEVLFTPYRLDGGWAGSAEPARWLEVLGRLVEPGFLDGVRRWRAMTPVEYETEFSMPKGHATSFAGGALAAFLGRVPELTRYRTPVRGLYLTGAATFPGAGVWGASGRNTALTILAERG